MQFLFHQFQDKKPGDFNSDIIIRCYNALIKDNIYKTYGTVGPFNTFSRYSGREAVFTAIPGKIMVAIILL